jgi:D-alanyl-D-alanine carboxypeptidase (penicillin-binding protein 5/6)
MATFYLAAMLVRSANDACHALTEHAGADFVDRMNRRAAALGLADTHFVDPCGHDRPGQYASAADLARLAEEAMRHPEFARLARARRGSLATLDGRQRFRFASTNALLGRYEGAIGIKTGTTDGAGHCVIALAERNGVRVLLVLLHARDRWWNAAGLLDRAFEAKPPL